MPDFIYDPDRLARLEDQFTRQAADIEGDHMTVDELEELKWQRATKAKAVALYKERGRVRRPGARRRHFEPGRTACRDA